MPAHIQVQPRQEIIEQVDEQLGPVFSEYYPNLPQYVLYQKNRDEFKKQDQRIIAFLHNQYDLSHNHGVGMTSSQAYGNHKTQAIFIDASTYLLETELIGTAYIDRVLLLLIGKGFDFHLEPDFNHRYTRHAKSLEDLQGPSLPLATKIDFLEANGVPFFSKWIDRQLRNKIAHLDYTIENDCFYVNKEGKKKRVSLFDKLQTFNEYYNAVTSFFEKHKA
jgi:hypothetical protein